MKKRFKSKKRKIIYSKGLIFLLVLSLSFYYVFNYLYKKTKDRIDKEEVISYLLFANNTKYTDFLKLNSKEFIIKYSLGIDISDEKENIKEEVKGEYIEDPVVINKIEEPLVYIYNTHQTEGYNKDILSPYNITPTVMLDSYMLRETLNNLGITTIVETTNISALLHENGWNYANSYMASRLLLEEAIKNNPSLKVFIDIHRDSSNYDSTTVVKDNLKYAKVLFVVGLDYSGYETNLLSAEKLNSYIDESFSRGILKKSGKGVNGIYNQDFRANTFLIEVGGQYNSIDEVKNSIGYLSEAIANYIKDEIYEEKE